MITVQLDLDCCGSSGVYERFKHLQKNNLLDGIEWIRGIRFNCPAQYDEVSFASAEGFGGKATCSKYHGDKQLRKDPYTESVDSFVFAKDE